MTFKTNLPDASCPTLSGFSLLEIRGADAAVFLQAQTMNDVAGLEPGQWQWNGWLTPKGRVVALFALLRVAPEHFLAVLPDFPAAELQLRLQRFVFRSKLSLRVAEDWLAASGPTLALPVPDRAEGALEHGWALDFGGDGAARTLWLLPAAHPALAPADAGADAAWLAVDFAHGLPRLATEAVEAWTPQMLSLERLSAFSLKKGCYPGQEIVARTHYLGQAKRGLAHLAGTGLAPGLAVASAAGPAAGTVVCADRHGQQALAVLAAETADAALSVGGEPCWRAPLLGGLSRPI